MKKGISLIVLVITIIVIIILAGAVILSLSTNNPIFSASEATFKSDMSNIKEEINLYTLANMQTDGTIKYPIKSEIKSADKYDAAALSISNGTILYKTPDLNYKNWAEELGLTVDYTYKLDNYYKMDGDAIDSASSNNGTTYGILLPSTDRFGKVNSALEFGSSGYSNIISDLIPFDGEATLCAWINPKQYPIERSTIALGITPGIGNSFYMSLYFDGSLQSFWYEKTPDGYHTTPAGVIPLNTWTFVCTTWDGSYNKLYVNGQLLKTVAVTGIGRLQSGLNIGAEGIGRQFYGSMDDVRVYNRALSQTEINNLYTNIK